MPPEIETEQEEPLDPAMERIRRKMVLLQLVSGGIMFVCFMAVLAAIVYKVSQRPDHPDTNVAQGGFAVPSGAPLVTNAALPAGFELLSSSLSGSQILLHGRLNGAPKLFVLDLAAGGIIADVTLTVAQ